jgi:hypothetical protein
MPFDAVVAVSLPVAEGVVELLQEIKNVVAASSIRVAILFLFMVLVLFG